MRLIFLCLFSLLLTNGFSQKIIYVDSSAQGLNNGSSWTNAYTSLDSALNRDTELTDEDSICVAKGTYRPSRAPRGIVVVDGRDFCFHFPTFCSVIGGYPSGGGTRDPKLNPTILSGDIGISGNDEDNVYHVTLFQESKAIVDGFTITGGVADGTGSLIVNGQEISRAIGADVMSDHSSLLMSNMLIKNAFAYYGAGLAISSSFFTMTMSFFSGNLAVYEGGGILNDSLSDLEIANCVFFDNQAESGGAIYNNKSINHINHSTFANNQSWAAGGAIFNSNVENCFIKNTVFSLNDSFWGFDGEGPTNDIAIDSSGGGGSNTVIAFSSLQSFAGGFECVYAGNSELVDPTDPDGPDNIWGTMDDGLVITPQSPGFNTGSNGTDDIDITSNPRNINSNFDMGAYEIDPCSRLTGRTVYVDSAQTGNRSGNSWDEALTSLQAAINLAVAGCVDTIKVAQGTYFPSTVPRNWQANQPNFLPVGFKTFHLPGNIVLLGGYEHAGTSRDPDLFPTILSHRVNSLSSSNQVVTAVLVNNVIFDGFTVMNGDASGGSVIIDYQSYPRNAGGGMLISGSEVIVRNCRFVKNKASTLGAGLYAHNSVVKIDRTQFENNNAYSTSLPFATGGGLYITGPRIGSYVKNSVFKNNSATYYGGGLGLNQCYNSIDIDSCFFSANNTRNTGGNVVGGGAIFSNISSRANISYCLFEDNTAYLGGAINLGDNSHTVIKQCFFASDSALSKGGAIFNGDALQLEIANSVFHNNSAPAGGAIEVQSFGTLIQGCTFYKNRATLSGAAVNDPFGVSVAITSSAFWRNTLNGSDVVPGADISVSSPGPISYNSFQIFNSDGSHSMTGANPVFRDTINLKGVDNIWGTNDDGLQLMAQSPLINEVPYGYYSDPDSNFIVSDVVGNPRTQNRNGDIGAYEADYCGLINFAERSIYVDSSVQGGNRTGDSWQNAFPSLEEGLKAARAHCDVDTIRVAKGTYLPRAAETYNVYNTPANSNAAVFMIPDSIIIQGGYPTGGGVRSIADNPTILKDIQTIKLLKFQNVSNSVLDGFILDHNGFDAVGATFTIKNCVIRNAFVNDATIELSGSRGNMINCAVERNRSTFGIIRQSNSIMSYTNCVFSNNIGGDACAFLFITGADSATVTNCTVFGNRGSLGGSIRLNHPLAMVSVANSVFWRNKYTSLPPDPFYNDISMAQGGSNLTVANSIFEYNPTTISPDNSSFYAIYPAFADSSSPAGADGVWGTHDDGLALSPLSPGFNGGLNALVPSGIETDITGINRIANDTVDMGAYEFDCRSEGRYTNMIVPFGTLETSTTTIADCGSMRYFQSPTTPARYIADINENGNSINSLSVTVDVTNTLVHFKTNGIDTTALANRMVSIVAPGSFSNNGGVKVRIYYDSTEFNSLPRRFRYWFKHPAHSKADVLADLQINGLRNAIILYPALTGTENGVAFVEFENISSFSTFGFMGSNIAMALPVDFISFNARQIGNLKKTELNWVTAREDNNDRFEIERSSDAIQWKMTGVVGGNGTILGASKYSFVDNLPDLPQSFYRIRQVDKDGKFTYSVVRIVRFSNEIGDNFIVGPNPASDKILIRFERLQRVANYELIDMSGRKVMEGVSMNVNDFYLNIRAVERGVYLLRINGQSKKLVITR